MKQNHCCFFASINYVKSRAIARKKIMAEAMSMKKLWMTEAISIVLNFLPTAFKMTKNSKATYTWLCEKMTTLKTCMFLQVHCTHPTVLTLQTQNGKTERK